MKITHVNTYCTGGAAKACFRITKAQSRVGIDARMLVLYKTNKEKLVTDIRDEWSLLENYKLKFRNKLYVRKQNALVGNKEELFSSYDPVWDVASHSLIRNSDVINLHWVSGFVNFPSFFKTVKKKIVFTLHDHGPFSGGYHYPNPLFSAGKFPELIHENQRMLHELYNGSNVSFVGPSQYIINQFNEVLGKGKFKTSVIKNPVDPGIYFPKSRKDIRAKYGYKEEDKILLFLNEHSDYKRKGFQILRSILPELSDNGIYLIIAGAKTGMNDPSVHETGYLYSEEELNNYYNIADFVLVPSLEDNLPNVISEANCAGTPVVAFDTGGIPEMISEDVNGYLVPKDDAYGFLETIKKVIKRSHDKNIIAHQAREVYSETKAAELYREVYR